MSRSLPLIAPSVPSVTLHARRQHVGNAGDARGELQVRHRVVRDGGAGAGEDFDLLVVEPDAMGEHRALVEQAEMLEVPDHRAAVAVGDVGLFGAGLGGMGGEEPARGLGGELRRHQVVRADGIGAVRKGSPGSTSSQPAYSREEIAPHRRRAGSAWPSMPGPSKKMPPVETRMPTVAGGGDGLVRVPEHVHHRGHPAEQQFGEAEHAPSRTVSG
jgi:hypothetical protein